MLRLLTILFMVMALFTACSSDDDGPEVLDPSVSISEDTLDFGTTDTLMTFNITNTGEGELTWSVGADSLWVELDPVSGAVTTETDVITVTVDRTGKPAGDYTSIITATTNAGTGTIAVRMTVVEDVELVLPNVGFEDPAVVDVQLTVANLTGVAGVELHIAYDTLEITYDTVLSDFLTSPTINASDGVVHIIWADIGNPLTLDDGDTLVTLRFTDLVTESDLTFLGTCEIVDIEGEPLPVSFTDGHIYYMTFAR
ncbi:MAG: BACON domain-containing protein [Candidatus Zixiibacteriota bacterium]